MFTDWLKRKKPADTGTNIRDALFGDRSFAHVAQNGDAGEPWQSFAAAKKALDHGDRNTCIATSTDIAGRQGLESRHYVQAWHFLRELGVAPAKENEKEVYGVIVEVGLEGGLDIIAAYPDLHARYYNYSGAAVIWERPDASLDEAIQKLLRSGSLVAAKIEPWTQVKPSSLGKDQTRINVLTPSGLHMAQAPTQAFCSSPLPGQVMGSAFALMKALIEKMKK